MKTPSTSGKKKKKISGVSPSMDLTRFGFSRTKRSSPTKTAPAKNNTSSNNAGCSNSDENLESPLKRQKLSSPVAKNNNSVGAGSVGKAKVKGKENGCSTPVENDKKKAAATTIKISSASRTALLDLTQSSSSEDGPSIKNGTTTSSTDDKGVKANDRKTAGGANLASLGGLANSIATQIVAASSRGKNTKQQITQQPVKQRRGKRDKITSISNDDKTKSAQQTKSPSNNIKSSSPLAKSFSPSKKKGSIYNNVQALALVRVVNPHEITCSTAVANARRQDQKQSKNNNTKQQQSWTPRRIFNGAILGRSSSSASAKQNFVDLGIGNKCMGISRHHLTVTNVRVKSDFASAVVEESQNTLSQASTTSTSTKNSTNSQSEPSAVTIQVNDKASNGVNVHRTKRGSRKTTFLQPGEKITLRIGDAIDFYSNEKFYYCVVGLDSLKDGITSQNSGKLAMEKEKEVAIVKEVEEVPTATKTATTLKKRTSDGNSAGSGGEERIKNLSKLSVDNEVEILDAKKLSTSKSRTSFKTPRNQDSSASIKTSDPNSTASVEGEITDTPRFPTESAMTKMSPAKSATKTTVGKSPEKRRQKSPMGPKSPQKNASVDANQVNLAASEDLESALGKDQEVESDMIKKGDTVKVRYDVEDWFGESQPEWFFGKVQRVKKNRKSSSGAYEIDVIYEDHEKKTLSYPDEDIEKLESSDCHSYPDKLNIGDSVDCYHQDGLRPGHEGKWYRGRVANISDDGDRCDVFYIDGDYESNIPTNDKKLRLIKRIDLNGLWMMNKKTTVAVDKDSNAYQYRTGQVTSCDGELFRVSFSDGTSESFEYADVATGVFAHFLKDLKQTDISLWPHSSSSSVSKTARLRRQMRDKIAAMKESVLSKKSIAAKQSAPRKNTLRAEKSVNTKVKDPEKPKRDIVRSVMYVQVNLDESSTDTPMKKGKRSVKRAKVDIGRWEEGSPVEDHCTESQNSCDNNDVALGKRKANDFPPGLANIIWSALNSQEPQTGANLLRNALSVQNIVPPTNFTEKLMDLIKFGPQAEGSSVYFKDPLRTSLASSYACALVSASSHLVRKDGSAIFGPTSWDDVEVLLSLSIDQTENAISGRRLAQGLQMAACGSNLLSTMLKNELVGIDMTSSDFSFDSSVLKLMPTVKILKSEGLRNVLKAVVRHTTSCLVRHSKWILDHDVNGFSSIERETASCCASEAKSTLDRLGSVLCYTAWLFCVEEGIDIDHPNCAFVVKDEFLTELTRGIENLPEMSSRKQTSFTKNVKLHFITSFVEEFAFPLQDSVGKMIGIGDLLDLI